MAKKTPSELKTIIPKAFPHLSFFGDAPQGQNNFSFNFKMKDETGKEYLLKVVRHASIDGADPAAISDEVKASSAVRSQYFVPLIESKVIDGYTLMLFSFLDGENLAEYRSRKGGILPEGEVKEIGISLLRGVADLTRHGIRHQDIKPENIFLTTNNEIKILDFGSARFREKTYKGKTKKNRWHSSPEQILGSNIKLESLRLTCDERSDVYSVGSVLYELLEGVTPFSSNENKIENALPRTIVRRGISDGTKRIIYRLLNFHPRNRPSASTAVQFLEKGDVETLEFARGGFYYNASTSLGRFLEVSNFEENFFDGLIVEASKIPASELAYLRSGPVAAIVDPQTYLFQAPKSAPKKFRELPYFNYGKTGGTTAIENITDKEGLIKSVFEYEISSGADILLPPFFFIKEFNDFSWTLDAEVTSTALSIYSDSQLQLPIFKGVAVAENILMSEPTRGKLLDLLTNTDWSNDIAGYFVLLECSQKDGLPSEAWLKAAREFMVELLSTKKAVIWSHAYIPSIVFAHSGVSVGMGEFQSQRSFSLVDDEPGIRRASSMVYLPKLFARLKWPSGVSALNAHQYTHRAELQCGDVCCASVDYANPAIRDGRDLAIHMIRQLGNQFKKYSGKGGALKAKKDLGVAKQIYRELNSHPDKIFRIAVQNEFKPQSGAFLDDWLRAFH